MFRLIILGATFLSLSAMALPLETNSKGEFIVPPELEKQLFQKQVEAQNKKLKKKYSWLYEILMPKYWQPLAEAEESFYPHFKDTLKNFMDPSLLKSENLIDPIERLPLTGKITYASIVRKKYKYDVTQDETGMITLEVRVHFKRASEDQFNLMNNKLYDATRMWNASRVKLDFDYQFLFKAEKDKKKAHFSVRLKEKTRGPYDTNWAHTWPSRVVAHEVGHMLGLGDEYQTISGKIDCLRSSLMCHGWRGHLQEWHYYHVLRRLMKAPETKFIQFAQLD